MKRICKGKLYDTSTAELVAKWDNGLYNTDFNCYEGQLFRTKSGAFFLVDDYYDDTYLNPMSDDEAYEWLEENDQVEAIEKYFPNRITVA